MGYISIKNKDVLINSFKQGLMDNLLPGSTGLSEDLIPEDIPLTLPTTPILPLPSTDLPIPLI